MDNLPTVWDAEPHTLAKHGILRTYLEAWVAILSRAPLATELLYVDGFAGPGEYRRGEPGSPIVALNSILDHSRSLPKSIRLRFIEWDEKRHAHLAKRLEREITRLPAGQSIIVEAPIRGDCDAEIRKLIAQRKRDRRALGPALFFLDQFGYSQVPMSLVCEIMAEDKCEVFSYLNNQRMNTFLSDRTKWAGITGAYGDDSWRPALKMTGRAREEFLIDTYTEAIRAHAKTDYVWRFAMFDSGNRLIHWLVFSTNHPMGLEHMKKAMWKADGSGQYRFSDRVQGAGQQTFLSTLEDGRLEEVLVQEFAGQTAEESQVRDFVLTKTPFYRFKADVNKLRTAGLVTPRKSGEWPVTFASDTDSPVGTPLLWDHSE